MAKGAPVKVYLLRIIHGLFAVYFLLCLVYLYYAAMVSRFDIWPLIAVVSLAIEGFLIFVFNKGDCPLIHVQRKIGDEKPFFELFFPSALAKRAIPIFAKLAWLALALLILRASVAFLPL